jgi:uncharacterized membrane protein
MRKSIFAHWRANFLTGLAVLLPALLTLAIVLWVFGSIANLTDKLLFFLPQTLTHSDEGRGAIYWYWSVVALCLGVALVTLAGWLARYYVGRQLIASMDSLILRVPLVNKIYSVIKQVNEAFTSNKKNAFKTVVLVEFPRAGIYSLGFVTAEQHAEVQARTQQHVVCVFVPTTPNPTSGFLILVPEDKLTKLEMSVPDGLKYIVSLGSVAPQWPPAPAPLTTG